MVDEISEERQMLKEAAAKTAQRIVQPRAREIDETGAYPPDLVDVFGRQGFLSILLPEEYGGTDGDITAFCFVIEEIAKVSASSSWLILSQGVGTIPIWLVGTPSQKEHYFSQIVEKNCLMAFALNERAMGFSATSIKTRAEKEEGAYRVNGSKSFVMNGGAAQLYSVFVITDSKGGEDGISALVIEAETSGLRFVKGEEMIGMRGVMNVDLIFEHCRVPLENRLGEEGKGRNIAHRTLDLSGPAFGALSVGLAQGALDYAIGYANERVQFNRPISSFQAIQFMIADMATQIEAARALVYRAAANIDAELEAIESLSAIAKCFASDVAMKVTTDAVQILGGYGYMKDYPVERMMRDAKVTQAYEVPNQLHRLAIANQLMSKPR